jgi:hypothetical protein
MIGDQAFLEDLMHKSYLLAASAALALILQTPLALAQSAPAAGDTPPAAATTAPPAASTPPAAASAPPATSAPATTTTPSAATDTSSPPTAAKKSAEKKPAETRNKPRKMTRQQEIDHSIDTGTVPARYRANVPREYQQYIPFDKR